MILTEKPKYLERNQFLCLFVHRNSHVLCKSNLVIDVHEAKFRQQYIVTYRIPELRNQDSPFETREDPFYAIRCCLCAPLSTFRPLFLTTSHLSSKQAISLILGATQQAGREEEKEAMEGVWQLGETVINGSAPNWPVLQRGSPVTCQTPSFSFSPGMILLCFPS